MSIQIGLRMVRGNSGGVVLTDMDAFVYGTYSLIYSSIPTCFFCENLFYLPDIEEVLTNYTIIDLDKSQTNCQDEIYSFLNSKDVSCENHLISGAVTSQIMSYLVNHQMLDEMQETADNNNAVMTVYVDDVTFSTENRTSRVNM